MEERLTQTTGEDTWNDEFSRVLAARRQQAADLLAAQQQQFQRIEAELEARLAEAEAHVAAGLSDSNGQSGTDLEQLAESLKQQAEQLSQQQAGLAGDRSEIASRQAELQLAREQLTKQHHDISDQLRQEREQLDHRAAELEVAAAKIKQAERALQLAQEEHQNELNQFTARRNRLDELQKRAEKEHEELDKGREDLRNQRRRIAQQFNVERTSLVHERELARAELDQQRAGIQKETERAQALLREDREAFEQEMNRARQQLKRDSLNSQHDTEAFEEARRQWEEDRRQLEQHRAQQAAELAAAQQEIQRAISALAQSQRTSTENRQLLTELQRQHEALREHVEKQAGGNEADAALITDLRQERAALLGRVQELERDLTQARQQPAAAPPDPENARQMEDLHRRFEMAVDDVRQLKRRNAELEEELAALQAGAAQPAGGEPAVDWESTKRRLMAQLQDDGEQFGGNLSDDERLTVEGAIRITDDVVSQRDQEIAALKQRLAEQPETPVPKPTPPSDAAVAEVLDRDALVQEERKRLLALQNEWQDKMRQAEVEISVQRAKIARERSDLEEKMRVLEDGKASLAADQASGTPRSPEDLKKPARRWLERLGLKETDNEKR
jgi:chromosome segregation ATPase